MRVKGAGPAQNATLGAGFILLRLLQAFPKCFDAQAVRDVLCEHLGCGVSCIT